ncbi:MAG: caspase family protein [Chitinophagaceae bacterium]
MPAIRTILLILFIATAGASYSQRPRLILPVGHVGGVDVSFSPDGKKILSLGDDGTAKIWDAFTGLMLADLVGHTAKIYNARYTPAGNKIITTSGDNTVKIWTATGELLRTLVPNRGNTAFFKFHNDGSQLILEHNNELKWELTIWEIASGKLLGVIDESRSRSIDGKTIGYPPQPLFFSPNGKFIARADNYKLSQDSVIIVITDVLSGKKLDTLEGFFPNFKSAQYSPDGKTILAIGARTYTRWGEVEKSPFIVKWDVSTGKLLNRLILDDQESYTYRLIQPGYDGKTVVSITSDSSRIETVKGWDITSGALLYSIIAQEESKTTYLFGPDNKTILIIDKDDSTAKIWDLASGQLLNNWSKSTPWKNNSYFLGKDKKFVAVMDDKAVKIWDMISGKLLHSLAHAAKVNSIQFGDGDKTLTVITGDNKINLWDIIPGKLLRSSVQGDDKVSAIQISPDKKYLAIVTKHTSVRDDEEEDELMGIVTVWDIFSPDSSWSFKIADKDVGVKFSPDSKSLVINYTDKKNEEDIVEIREVQTGRKRTNFRGNAAYVNSAVFSPDEKKILTTSFDNTAKIWNTNTGHFLFALKGHKGIVNSAQFSPACPDDPIGGKHIITASDDSTAKVWDAGAGVLLFTLAGHTGSVSSSQFSADGKRIVTSSDSGNKIWDAFTGKLLRTFGDDGNEHTRFSPDGKYILANATLWDAKTGKRLFDLDWHNGAINSTRFSPDSKFIITASADKTAKLWSTEYGDLIYSLNDHTEEVVFASFDETGKKIITASLDNTVKVWDAKTGSQERCIDLGPNIIAKDIQSKGDFLLCVSGGAEIKIIQFATGEPLYSFFAVDSTNYLVADKNNHYDGTEGARKLLYFVCEDEVIELDRVKDQLWVPNLAERIMKGDSINAKSLDELDICGLTPLVEDIKDNEKEYHFKILPRHGGLGETVLFVNGIETKRYKRADLKNNGGLYELLVKKEELKNYFIPGKENTVTVKAYTADNAISSRGIIITSTDTTQTNSIAPNLYAVMVGVSDYKGDELDLKYAAKDATDISNAIAVASRKLLNDDGKEHVFMYDLTTATEHYQLPEKNSIKKTLEEIGKKAIANDILLIFFAGHGVMRGNTDKKQFYFLTADASMSSSIDATADVGISTDELTEWMKPANIKAQKRILIFDACNSGQAVNDLVKIGKPEQGYRAARNDEKGQQVKAIERLNNQSGLFILAASASDQNAYEMGRYSQGLLTYSLLKAIKQQPEILETGKYLDVNNWLNAAKKTVSNLTEETGARQEPQINASNNFNIGMVDDDVRSKIILSSEKPLFARSNFRNTDTRTDNLKFRSAIDKELMSISSRGAHGAITYSADYEGSDAYSLTGDYKISGDKITVSVLLTKGGTEILYSFEKAGNSSDLNALVISITGAALDWLKTH